MKDEKNRIDFVLTWVDGSDPDWQAVRRRYSPDKGADGGTARYRDWENLQYWFRGVEKFAPWVDKIYFVTWGHVPAWLNTDHPKLRIVRHEDYMKPEYLPTFNINSIELNFHHIPGLSERFVYFNDDMFLLKEVTEQDFFQDGLPRDCCIETALVQDDIRNPFAAMLMNDAALVNMHYKKRIVIKQQWKKWFHPAYGKMALRNLLMLPYKEFSSFKYTHLPSAFLKQTYEELWETEGEILDEVCRNRFRTSFDVNQYVLKYWQYMSGRFVPQSPKVGRFFTVGLHDEAIHETIREQKCKMICINDTAEVGDFEQQKERICQSFASILPKRSSFERESGEA